MDTDNVTNANDHLHYSITRTLLNVEASLTLEMEVGANWMSLMSPKQLLLLKEITELLFSMLFNDLKKYFFCMRNSFQLNTQALLGFCMHLYPIAYMQFLMCHY
jgi:hypothetical protein